MVSGARWSNALGAAIVLVSFALISFPSDPWAQSTATGAIAGAVTDSTGKVMAGVTITATSPALIEGTRVVVTNEHGEYKIESLRPGLYKVTFSSPGFASIEREGLELNTGITLPIDAQMNV